MKRYVALDCVLGGGSVLSAGVLLGGRVVVEVGATIGLGATVHQRCHIGAWAMIGMQTPVTRDILPYATVAGNPARIIGFNRMGAERKETDITLLEEMDAFFKNEIKSDMVSQNHMIKAVITFLHQYPDSLFQIKSDTL